MKKAFLLIPLFIIMTNTSSTVRAEEFADGFGIGVFLGTVPFFPGYMASLMTLCNWQCVSRDEKFGFCAGITLPTIVYAIPGIKTLKLLKLHGRPTDRLLTLATIGLLQVIYNTYLASMVLHKN